MSNPPTSEARAKACEAAREIYRAFDASDRYDVRSIVPIIAAALSSARAAGLEEAAGIVERHVEGRRAQVEPCQQAGGAIQALYLKIGEGEAILAAIRAAKGESRG